MFISGGDQCQGFSAVFSSGGSPDSMDVVFRVMRHVIIDNERHIGYINPARNHIGCHQHRHFAIPKIQHNLVTLLLLQVGMHCARVYMERAKRAREFLHTLFLAGKKDDFFEGRGVTGDG